ncbi:MAG: hypothetical protein KDE15_12915 [Erythrobacter sp.]|nr:hypothetical protein [Erythrobacter sp.]
MIGALSYSGAARSAGAMINASLPAGNAALLRVLAHSAFSLQDSVTPVTPCKQSIENRTYHG